MPSWQHATIILADTQRLGRFAKQQTTISAVTPRNGDSKPPYHDDRPWFKSADDLAEAVDACFQAAERGESKLTPAVLSVPGMTSIPIRHLLNCLGELHGCRYLEIEALYRATLVAASYENSGSFRSVDNFSNFNDPDPQPILRANLNRFRDQCKCDFRELDCWRLPSELQPGSVNVYFYDGDHEFESQRDALARFSDIFVDPFVLLVDDWNLDSVRMGTEAALEQLGWSVHKEWCRHTGYNGDAGTWWNGLFVAVIEKAHRPHAEERRLSPPMPALAP